MKLAVCWDAQNYLVIYKFKTNQTLFLHFLDGSRAVTLEKILIFVSGVEQIPPLGFPQRPQIQFLHTPLEDSTWRRYPEANTCSIILRLPIHATFENFVEYMESGILQSPTFGFV